MDTPRRFTIGQTVTFLNDRALVKHIRRDKEKNIYYLLCGPCEIGMWVSEEFLLDERKKNLGGYSENIFHKRTPHILVIDHFYKDPELVRQLALDQEFHAGPMHYKGKRTRERFLWPHHREEFERLIGKTIIDWVSPTQAANGCFQITGFDDPLVWHSDSQDYAAAIYLTPDAPVGAGTSFWRDKTHGLRRPPSHPFEIDHFKNQEDIKKAVTEVYNERNLLRSDDWELVDKVGSVYNRLVLWDAQLIHSASSYAGLESGANDKARLVQLFFFNVR